MQNQTQTLTEGAEEQRGKTCTSIPAAVPSVFKDVQMKTETVGRKFQKEGYAVHSRRINGDGKWFGWPKRYGTLVEAKESVNKSGQPILGGMVSFNGGAKEEYEYRIVREVSECEVVHVERRML